MTPYLATATEVVSTFGTTGSRRDILRGWLDHRAALRGLGFVAGFQWLDGSFVEAKDPQDLDVVTFTHRPAGAPTHQQLRLLMAANPQQFARAQVKALHRLDAFFLDLNASGPGLVNSTRYYLGLFSHRRGDDLWKGMLQVMLDDPQDDAAALGSLNAIYPVGVAP